MKDRSSPVPTGTPDVAGLPLEQLRLLWKHRWLVLSGIAIALCVDALWVLRQPKVYAASVSIQFEPNPPRPLGRQVEEVDSGGVSSYWNIREYYETQYKVARSRGVAEGVVRRLGLHHDPDFMGVAPARRATWRSVTVADAANVLIGRTRVDPVKDSRLMNVVVEDVNPRRAQLLANTIADVYIQRNLDHRLFSTRDAVRWLSNQLEELRERLVQSENALQDFRRRHNIVSDSFVDQRNILGNRIEKLSDALTETQTRRIALAARVAELRRAGASRDPLEHAAPEFLQSALLSTLRAQYEVARREQEGLDARYGPNAQPMQRALRHTAEVADAIRHEVSNITRAAEAELRSVTRAEGGIRDELDRAQHLAVELNQQEIAYQQLNRERENHSKIYGIVLERTTEGNLMRDLQVNNMSVLDYALVPVSPIKPRVGVSLALGALAGLVLGILAAFVAIQADRTVRSRADIEEVLAATFLGYLPHVSERRLRNQYRYQYGSTRGAPEAPIENLDLVVHSHPTSMIAELARGIRTNLLFMSPDTPFQSLMVTSAAPQEGKTFTAISLAVTLAQSGKRVLLVDGDLRRPRIHKVFRVRPPVGLTSVLIGEATPEEATLETEVPNLFLLPCGPVPPNPSELLHSQRASELFRSLRDRFDRVVFDSPPITAVTDALVLGPQLDGVVLVVRTRKTRRDQAGVVIRQLRDLGSRVVGCVLNAVDTRDGAPGYYYGGSYDYSPHPAERTTGA